MKNQVQIQASDLVSLLAVKHGKDLFVPECKDGPTWTANHLRLDVWAMKRSWAQWNTWGYEIKVSRSDFINDNKWPGYLPLCNEFSFVCPSGLIQPEELPDGVGLLWAAKTGTRLFTKRKAPHREIEPPTNLLIYILMCRASIGSEFGVASSREHTIQWWKDWLDGRKEDGLLGHRVSVALAVLMQDLKDRTFHAEKLVSDTQGLRDMIETMVGMKVHEFARNYNKEGVLAKALACVPEGLVRDIRYQAKQMTTVADKLELLSVANRSADEKDEF